MRSHCESYREAIEFLYGLRWFGTKLGLDNTVKLAALAIGRLAFVVDSR